LTSFRGRALIGLCLLSGILALTVVPMARADNISNSSSDTVLSYTGNGMTAVIGVCPQPCSISATFDVSAALSSNYSGPGLDVAPVSYTINAAGLSLTSANSSLLEGLEVFSTDSAGDPTSWAFTASGTGVQIVTSIDTAAGAVDDILTSTYAGANVDDGGTWTTTSVPEPASLLLLGMGMLGLLGVGGRRK